MGVSPEEIPKQLGIHRATIYRLLNPIKFKKINKITNKL